MNLEHIAIKVEDPTASSIGNLDALLSEIATCLERLAAKGETWVIDLHGLPLAPGEYEQLRQTLGRGEVSAQMDAIGPSKISETRYPGVWWVTHSNVEGDIIADAIEITFLPDILKSQPEDVRAGLKELKEMLAQPAQLNA